MSPRIAYRQSAMSDLRIEPATLDDLLELAELLGELFTEEEDFTPNPEKQVRGLRLILEQPSRGRIFVLRNQTKIVGMINLLITISTAEGGFVLLLEDLVIRREHRRQGYGSRLLKHAIEFARQKNFLRITLLTDRPSESRAIYLKHGFVESGMVTMRYLFSNGA
ncbi:MAG: GNAT family N-acetyltransferase [Verrucomicrobiae bacterium]